MYGGALRPASHRLGIGRFGFSSRIASPATGRFGCGGRWGWCMFGAPVGGGGLFAGSPWWLRFRCQMWSFRRGDVLVVTAFRMGVTPVTGGVFAGHRLLSAVTAGVTA